MARLFAILALAIGSFVPFALAQDNLIPKGSIDAVDDNRTGGWTIALSDLRDGKPAPPDQVSESERIKADFHVVPALEASGKMLSLKVLSGQGRAAWCFPVPKAAELMKPGQKYRLSFKLKYNLAAESRAGTGVTARINLWDVKWKNLLELYALPAGNYRSPFKQKFPPQPMAGEWKDYAAVFTAPEGIARAAGHIGLTGVAGDLFVDDVSLAEVAVETPEGPFAELQ